MSTHLEWEFKKDSTLGIYAVLGIALLIGCIPIIWDSFHTTSRIEVEDGSCAFKLVIKRPWQAAETDIYRWNSQDGQWISDHGAVWGNEINE